nr:exodeoxyribonuclease VII large subunit [Rhodospirillaceae bacterium]MBT7510654.1 exodeoxyribonuclease VII large subunit [Rhodospirillaceae bacterium]
MIHTLAMNDDTSISNTAHNLPEMSVSEISGALKAMVEGAFQRVRVRGEISGFKRAPSGHLYFALKDTDAVLDGVCWKGTAARLRVAPEDGLEIIATGRLTTYAGRSKYQIVVDSIEMAGEGALLKLLEDRRRQLAAEGLFDESRKVDPPFLPEVIGIVTSPTGAVIRDILHRLADRFPRHVLVWPVLVQGDGAAKQIAAAIQGFNDLAEGAAVPRPDVLIVARGGGSVEDLWAFNEEIVVRVAAESVIPLISAVGHETDTTLIDFASDLRAPTPTAAAELAVPVRHELLAQVMDDGARLVSAAHRMVRDGRTRLDGLSRGLPDLKRMIGEHAQRLDDWSERLTNSLGVGLMARQRDLAAVAGRLRKPNQRIDQAAERLAQESHTLKRAMTATLKDRRTRLAQAAALLESYSHERVLERGFALVTGADGEAVKSVTNLSSADNVGLRFYDGHADATITKTDGKPVGVSKKPAKKPGPKRPADERQGKLL